MDASATINARMPEALKQCGTAVLHQNDVSPTELVRSVYRYMGKHHEIPPCLDVAPGNVESVYERRRKMLRDVTGSIELPTDAPGSVHAASGEVATPAAHANGAASNSAAFDTQAYRAARIEEKYGDLL